jgi:hypothetical protein
MPKQEASDGCKMKGAAPYFLVDDVFATAEFYRDFLGTIVERDGVCILFRQVRPARPPVARPNGSVMGGTYDTYIYVSDVDKLATELRAKKVEIVEGPINRTYDMRELVVRDCNGYVLAFGEG